MSFRNWASMVAIIQALALWPLRTVLTAEWFAASVVAGLLGLMLLVIPRYFYGYRDPAIDGYPELYIGDSDLTGHKATSLLDHLAGNDTD